MKTLKLTDKELGWLRRELKKIIVSVNLSQVEIRKEIATHEKIMQKIYKEQGK